MAPSRFLLTAVLIAVHSFTPAYATEEAATITASPPARRTPSHYDLAKRAAAATTYETLTPLPLTVYEYPYSAIPEQVMPYAVGRGPQAGFNICNSTTENPTSECQTMVVNDLADFCLWGSPMADGAIGDVEAAVVAYCTKPGHGTRLIPNGAITGAQFMRTTAYIQLTGFFNQTAALNLQFNDTGGELDPHGADLLGNPIGGLVYSTGLPSGDNSTILQATSWNNFVGSGMFCIKVCDPKVTSPNYCENVFDLIGCAYNMPAAYVDNEFTSCEGELQDPAGTYTSGGQTLTWKQPAILPGDSTLPWTPRIPASSNCVTYSSVQLYGGTSTSAPSATGTSSGAAQGSGSTASSSTGSKPTGAASNGAGKLVAGSGMLAVLAAALLLV